MSSRTAAARKRLQSPSPPTPPSGSSKSPFKLSVFKNSNKGRSLRRSDERLPSSSLSDSHLPRIPENDSALHNELGHITDPALPTPSPSFGPNQRPHHVHATGHLAQEHNTPANYFSDKDVSPGNRGVRHRFVSEDMPTTKSSSLVQLRSSETRHPVIGSAAPIQSSSLTTLPVQLNRLALNSKQSYLSPPPSSASSCFDAVTPPIQHPYLSKSNFYTQPSISDSASTFSKVNSIQFSDLSEMRSATSSVTQNSLHSPSLTDNVLSSTPSRVKFDLSSVDEIQLEGPPPVPFVFPTTRSRAHPKSDKPVFRFRKKNKKAKPVTAGSPSYSNPVTPSSEPVRSLRPISPIGRSSETSSDTSSSQLPTRDKRSAPSADTAATTSFVFPSSRSRAHSTSSPRKLKSKKEEKSKSSLNPQLLPSVWEQQYSRGIASNDKGGIIRPGTRSWRDVPILGNDIDIFSSTTTESYVPAPGTNHFIGRNLAMSDPGVDSSVGSGFQKTPYASSISSSEAEARRPLPVLSSDASFTPLSAQSSCIGISLSQSQDITETPGFSYPFDPYDPVLLESDKYTHKLLQKLISLASVSGNLKTKSEPSFHHYGNHPPLKVLDLGCGVEGLWVREAAMKWGGYGTVIIGMDSARMKRGMGSMGNGVHFIQGNFITHPLPFPNNTFDLVRIANLTYSVPYDKWEILLREVNRVLMIGGRLELIDDHVLWPYGKLPSMIDDARDKGEQINDEDQTDFGNESDDWHGHLAISQSLERLFKHLMEDSCGIHLTPSGFLLDMVQRIMGHAREMETMNLMLASPGPDGKSNHGVSARETDSDVFQGSPGLVLWPATLIPLTPQELQAQALRHVRLLLTCRETLIKKYLAEMGFFDGVENQCSIGDYEEYHVQEVTDALNDYEDFLHLRFMPPNRSSDIDNPQTSGKYRARSRDPSPSGLSVSSVATDQHFAMLDHMLELRGKFDCDESSGEPSFPSPNISSIPVRTREKEPRVPLSATPPNPSSQRYRGPHVTQTSRSSIKTKRDVLPEYSTVEPTLVRTFHVYEGIKLDGNMRAWMGEGSTEENDLMVNLDVRAFP